MKHLNESDDEIFTCDCTNSLNFEVYFILLRFLFSGVQATEVFISLGFRKGKRDCMLKVTLVQITH